MQNHYNFKLLTKQGNVLKWETIDLANLQGRKLA